MSFSSSKNKFFRVSSMEAVALSLGLDAAYFLRLYTRDPLILFASSTTPRSRRTRHRFGASASTPTTASSPSFFKTIVAAFK